MCRFPFKYDSFFSTDVGRPIRPPSGCINPSIFPDANVFTTSDKRRKRLC